MIVVNDNGRSYTPTIGGLATALTALRTNPRYEQVLDLVKKRLTAVPGVGAAAYDALHAMKKGLKDALAPQGLFEDLGLKYVGPIDGHDRAARGAGAGAGQAIRRPGHRARASPARASATTRPSSTRRTSSTRRARSTSRPARRAPRGGSGPTSSPTRWCTSAPTPRRRGDHRRDDAPGRARQVPGPLPRAHLRRRDRRAARGHLGRRAGDGRPAPGRRGLRHLPQPGLRPGADGRAPCTGAASPSCSTAPA